MNSQQLSHSVKPPKHLGLQACDIIVMRIVASDLPPPSHIVNTSAVSDDFKWGKKMDLLLGSLHLKDKEIEKAEHACKSLFYLPTARNSPSICRLLVWKNDVSSMCCKRRPGVQMRMFVRWIRADSCFRSCNRSKGKFYQLSNLHSIHFNCSNGSVPIRTES